MSDRPRRDFLKTSFSLVAFASANPISLLGRINACHTDDDPNGTTMVSGKFQIKVSKFQTYETLNNVGRKIKIGLTEVGSSIKLATEKEMQMNPDHCDRSGTDGKCYPIAVVRVEESGEDAFTAVSTWCPHNAKSQIDYFDVSLGENGLFVCREHELSSYQADGTWVSPKESPFKNAPPLSEFNLAPGQTTPYLTRFSTRFDDDDTLTISDVLCECKSSDCDSTSVEDEGNLGLSLEQNYPNPVTHLTVIRFTLPAPGDCTLCILSTEGKMMKTPIDRKLEAGSHRIDFDARALPSGLYFYKLDTPYGTKTRRMTVVR